MYFTTLEYAASNLFFYFEITEDDHKDLYHQPLSPDAFRNVIVQCLSLCNWFMGLDCDLSAGARWEKKAANKSRACLEKI